MRRWSVVTLAILLGIATVLAVREKQVSSSRASRIAQLETENRQIRERLAESVRAAELAASHLENRSTVQQENPPAPKLAPKREPLVSNPGDALAIRNLRENLGVASGSIGRLQTQVLNLQAEVASLRLDNKRLSGSEADLKEGLSSANRVIEAMKAELKSKNDRLLQLEIANRKLQEETGAGAQKSSQLVHLSSELQELHRRRETYLHNIMQRYKEVTDQYRILSAALENRRDRDGMSMGGTDLARIQNTIAMAEEDLRQVNTLNAQALRLQKQMGTK